MKGLMKIIGMILGILGLSAKATAKKKAKVKKIDTKVTSRIWKNMIWSYIDFEKRNFK